MTNVKAGDLAICVANKPCYKGRIFQVIAPAPTHEFELPNGRISVAPKTHPCWVLKAVGGPVSCPTNIVGLREMVWYGVGADAYLRPLPSDPNEVSEQTEQPVAVQTESK